MIVETERLVLRPLTINDLDAIAAINANASAMRFFPSALTRAQSADAIARYGAGLAKNGFTFLGVELEQTGEVVGITGISRFDDETRNAIPSQPEIEVGWRIDPKYWGQGIAPEAARACLAYGFEKLKFSEIVAVTVPANMPSRRVMEKIGMLHDPACNFKHPKIDPNNPLSEHVLYRMSKAQYFDQKTQLSDLPSPNATR